VLHAVQLGLGAHMFCYSAPVVRVELHPLQHPTGGAGKAWRCSSHSSTPKLAEQTAAC
jgi:hypothetical protein